MFIASQNHEVKVSICCAWYNRASYIDTTLASLLEQKFGSYEIIVVNDGSTDRAVQQRLEALAGDNLTVVQQSNTGLTKALIHAISLARGEYIAIQDAGDISRPDRIAKQARELEENPDVVCVGCAIETMRADAPQTDPPKTAPGGHSRVTRQDFLYGKNYLSHGEAMFRREVYDRVGGYRPAFYFAQDIDLWLRMTEQGSVHILPEVLYRRIVFTDGVKGSLRKSIVQKYLSHFARECALMRDSNGRDLVDIFGNQALLYRKHTRRLADLMARYALWFLYHKDTASARLAAELAWREKITARSLTARVFAQACARSEWACYVVDALVRKRISAQPFEPPDEPL